MIPKAIVYTSNTGYTAEYAALLGQKTGLSVYSSAEAEKNLPAGTGIIYLGWLMASGIRGYQKAARRFSVLAVCAVGISGSAAEQQVRKANALPEDLPLFLLQGGLNRSKLGGIHRLMMRMVSKALIAELSRKEERTPEEERMLSLLLHGGSFVSEENLAAVLAWHQSQEMNA